MKSYQFEKLDVEFGKLISFLDLSGNTRYGYIYKYDGLTPSFEFKETDQQLTETVYLKDVQTIFLNE